MTRARALATVGTALAGVALLAGCATGNTPDGNSTSTPATTPTTSPVPITTPDTSVITLPSTTPDSPSPTHSTTTAVLPANTCTNLTIRVLQGGAIHGQEIAAVTFVNDGAKACTISGYPSVALNRNGSVLVTATPTSGTVAQPVRLAPGGQAESKLTDYSTCNAPLSDTIEVTAPNGATGGKLSRPFALRGCRVDVDPVKPGS